MIKRLSSLLILILSLAPLSLARVISYAPYTDQGAQRGYGLRTSRYFVLVESNPANVSQDLVYDATVVLYDATGADEPKVIYPTSETAATLVSFAAVFHAGGSAQPVILIGTITDTGLGSPPIQTPSTYISADGGTTWRRITNLDGKFAHRDTDLDLGGPYTRGMAVSVRLGTAAYPFVVSQMDGSVWAIPPAGDARQLMAANGIYQNTLVGQNRAGTRFLVRTSWTTLGVVDLDGKVTDLGTVDQHSNYSGWITDAGDVYVLRHRADGRFLSLYRNGQKEFIAGPYDTPEPGNGPPMTSRNTMSFLAVPAFDFNGAWMVQRDATKPTTLLRHVPGQTLEKMWTDISGPEVEALHAGSSGERLLIQVHRTRPVQVPFIDPALAIWKVGEPAPRAYDELFLNEGIMKGFVYLDVEKAAAGEPFVFDSSFVQGAPEIIVSPPISGGGDVIQEWGVVRASFKQRLVLPGVARLPGAFGSYWQTDVVLYNPLDEKQKVDVQFVSLGEEVQIAATNTVSVTLEPQEIRVVNDVLKSLFGIDNGGGALYFAPESAINATSRTYSKAATGGGTFGFGMMAIDFWNAAGPRFPLSFAGAFPGSNYRTNILLTDTSGRGTEASLQAYGVSGTIGSTDAAVAAPTNGVSQTNGVGGMLGLFSHESGGLVVRPTRGSAIPAVVAIDNRTNDPTYFPPDLPASIIRTIPVIGHVDGAHGSRFRSDVYLLNLSATVRTVTLEAKRWEGAEPPKVIRFTLLPNEARVIEDVLLKLFNMQGLARLRYWSDGAPGDASGVRVTSRTYNIDANGATYGCLIPPLNAFQSATAGEALEIIGIVGGSGFRTNLGLVELTPAPNGRETNVRLTIFDEKGKQLDRFTVTLPNAGGMQINDIFGGRGIPAPAAARVVVEVLDATGMVGAYATLTDNVTNDSTFLGANLGANPN